MTEKRGPGRPKEVDGEYAPTRSLRVGDVWDVALAIAKWRGDKLSAIVTRALQMYVDLNRAAWEAAGSPSGKKNSKES